MIHRMQKAGWRRAPGAGVDRFDLGQVEGWVNPESGRKKVKADQGTVFGTDETGEGFLKNRL